MEIKGFHYARTNYRASDYVDIAAKNFIQAESLLETFSKYIGNPSLHTGDFPYSDISQYTVSTIIFSALAAESFINDYACTILGDKIFKENFESLRVVSKLQLCHIVVTGRAIDTGSSKCYSLLKQLTDWRNNLVHNKSFEIYGKPSAGKYEDTPKDESIGTFSYEDDLNYFFLELKKDLHNAYDALRAVFELARLIDSINNIAYAELQLFGSDNGCGYSEQLDRVRRMLRASEKPPILRKK